MKEQGAKSRSLNTDNANKYTLSIRLATDGFCFVVAEAGTRRIVQAECISELPWSKCSEVIKSKGLLQTDFAHVWGEIMPQQCTLMPLSFEMNDAQTQELFTLNFGEADSHLPIRTSPLAQHGIKLIYRSDEEAENRMKELFPAISFVPVQQTLVTAAIRQSMKNENQTIVVMTRAGFMDIAMAQKGNLIFINTYIQDGEEDIIFHTLNLMKNFSLGQLSTTIILAGQAEKDSTIVNKLKLYVTHADLATFGSSDMASDMQRKLKNQHLYYDLANITPCA